MKREDSRYPCVISSGALWLLVSAARSMQLVPGLSPEELTRLTEAIAAAHRSLGDAAPRARRFPSPRFVPSEELEITG